MKKLALATASVLALGIAGAGVVNAQSSYSTPSAQPPSSATTQTPSSAAPSQGHQGQASAVNLSESQIKQAQQQLKGVGLYKGSVDGQMGPEMKQAVSQFQLQHALGQTGVLDQQTLSALNSSQSSAGSSTSSSQPPAAGAPGTRSQSTTPSTGR
jgi:peptidoglycan hydrolase-like protein with peptidoglycan-binding domain